MSQIDPAALRAEMERLKKTPDVRAYHKARAILAGLAGKGITRRREKQKQKRVAQIA